MLGKAIGVALVLAVAVVAWLLAVGTLTIPDQLNPFAPLDLAQEPNFLTRYKLDRLARDGEACRATLAQSPFRFTPLPDREPRDGCGWRDAVRIDATGAGIGEAFTLTCEAAVALALFERHALQPAAIAHFGEPVARIRHYGSYACRNVYGQPHGRRSEHATANALDIAGFRLRDGREISVRGDWAGDDSKSAFLHDVHRGACRFFDAVLGPGYNTAHADHLHVDRGVHRVCR